MIFLHCRHCGLRDPSWSELGHFVNFLAAQLDACTNSIFCDENMVGDTLRGMKDFVVKFMIRMSRVSSFGAQMTCQFLPNKNNRILPHLHCKESLPMSVLPSTKAKQISTALPCTRSMSKRNGRKGMDYYIFHDFCD